MKDSYSQLTKDFRYKTEDCPEKKLFIQVIAGTLCYLVFPPQLSGKELAGN